MPAIYAVGDIHGHLSQLETALARIEDDGGQDAEIVFLGDYIDRGPDSRGVIERLSQGISEGRNWTCLKGNHDAYLQGFLETGTAVSIAHPDLSWFDPRLGGTETMRSYGVDVGGRAPSDVLEEARAKVPAAHHAFLKSLAFSHQTESMFFAHAGIRPGVALDQQDPHDLIWIRKEFLADTRDHGKLIVHGHTAVDTPEHAGNRVNLDGGAGFGRPLYPCVFEDGQALVLTENGRTQLTPKTAMEAQ